MILGAVFCLYPLSSWRVIEQIWSFCVRLDRGEALKRLEDHPVPLKRDPLDESSRIEKARKSPNPVLMLLLTLGSASPNSSERIPGLIRLALLGIVVVKPINLQISGLSRG